MEEEKRTIRSIHTQKKLDHVPELIHRIQSLLLPEEAARTCVLSKSWLHAWSMIPNVRFPKSGTFGSKKQTSDIYKVVERTLLRYIRDDIPFEKIDLSIDIENHELASFAEKWIRLIATKSCLKELGLSIAYGSIGSFTMPDEIFSSNKLYKMSITGWNIQMTPGTQFLLIIRNPVINCVALRVLELQNVSISEDVFEKLLSTCILLEKIMLGCCTGLKNIKVRNLRYLSELIFHPREKNSQIVEIYDVPNIHSFEYVSVFRTNPVTLNIDSLGRVTKLTLDGPFMDESLFDMLKSKFHSLESLTLGVRFRNSECLDITCPPLKRLHIRTSFPKIQVYAPKLHFFRCDSSTMPSLVFPAIAPAQIRLHLHIINTDDDLFFVNLAEALMLSSEFDIKISTTRFGLLEPLKIDIDDLRTRFTIRATNVQNQSVQTFSDKGLWKHSPFFKAFFSIFQNKVNRTRFTIPATNVQNLSVKTYADNGLWKHSSFFDAFFLICHPKHVVAYQDLKYKDNNYFCKLMSKEVMEKKTRKGFWRDYLKEVEIKNDGGNWETLTPSWKSSLDRPSLLSYEFKLHWC